MRSAYFEFGRCASLEEIATSWNSRGQLNGLFNQKRIEITDFECEDIVFGRPRKMDLGVYCLMLEIDHVHRGTICACEHP